jgi:hypothetical protein
MIFGINKRFKNDLKRHQFSYRPSNVGLEVFKAAAAK